MDKDYLGKAFSPIDTCAPSAPIQTQGSGCAFSSDGLIDHLFSYHAPYGTQTMQYEAIRAAAKYFAKVLVQNTPKGADQSAAIRKLRETVQTANASIALDGVSF